MGSLHEAFKEEVKKTLRHFATQLIAEKLEEAGVRDTPGLGKKIVEHMLNGHSGPFTWDDGRPPDAPERYIELTLSKKDFEKLDESISYFLKDKLPKLIDEVSRDAAKSALRTFEADWPEYNAYDAALHADFQEHLEERWGEGFDLLRMLLAVSRDIGEETYKRLRKSRVRKNRVLRSVLLRLHARACQVTAEIIVLMENGYADGAMARWRTLHEIEVVATVIADGGESLAERYVEHQVVESKIGLDEYDHSCVSLGYRPISARERRRIERAYDAAIQKYGDNFRKPYGWAAKHPKDKPTFRDLELAAQHSVMRSYYKMASYNVHAGAKGIFFRLSLLSDQSHIIAGPTNAGFLDPGENTAITLTQITSLLYKGRKQSLDTIVEMRVLLLIRDKISRTLLRAERKLRRDEGGCANRFKYLNTFGNHLPSPGPLAAPTRRRRAHRACWIG